MKIPFDIFRRFIRKESHNLKMLNEILTKHYGSVGRRNQFEERKEKNASFKQQIGKTILTNPIRIY